MLKNCLGGGINADVGHDHGGGHPGMEHAALPSLEGKLCPCRMAGALSSAGCV